MPIEIDRSQFVYGEIELPFFRSLGCRIGSFAMRFNIPGSSWLYFRSLLGGGVEFETGTLDIGAATMTADEIKAVWPPCHKCGASQRLIELSGRRYILQCDCNREAIARSLREQT